MGANRGLEDGKRARGEFVFFEDGDLIFAVRNMLVSLLNIHELLWIKAIRNQRPRLNSESGRERRRWKWDAREF